MGERKNSRVAVTPEPQTVDQEAPDSLSRAAFSTLWGLPRRIRLLVLFSLVATAALFALWTSLPESTKKNLLSRLGFESSYVDGGGLRISQVLYGKVDNNKFMSIVLNNSTNRNYVVQKIVYSRGRSSAMAIQNMSCCPFCGGPAIYVVDEFDTTSGAAGNHLQVSFRENSAKDEAYSGRLAFSHGCSYPTFAQLELPVAISIAKESTFNIKVYVGSGSESPKAKGGAVDSGDSPFSIHDILAAPDSACVYIYTDRSSRLEHCTPEEELVEGTLFL